MGKSILSDDEKLLIDLQCIRRKIEGIAASLSDLESRQSSIAEDVERQVELLRSIDHWHYRVTSREAIALNRIFWLLFSGHMFALFVWATW